MGGPSAGGLRYIWGGHESSGKETMTNWGIQKRIRSLVDPSGRDWTFRGSVFTARLPMVLVRLKGCRPFEPRYVESLGKV